jgi:hypothetical protein
MYAVILPILVAGALVVGLNKADVHTSIFATNTDQVQWMGPQDAPPDAAMLDAAAMSDAQQGIVNDALAALTANGVAEAPLVDGGLAITAIEGLNDEIARRTAAHNATAPADQQIQPPQFLVFTMGGQIFADAGMLATVRGFSAAARAELNTHEQYHIDHPDKTEAEAQAAAPIETARLEAMGAFAPAVTAAATGIVGGTLTGLSAANIAEGAPMNIAISQAALEGRTPDAVATLQRLTAIAEGRPVQLIVYDVQDGVTDAQVQGLVNAMGATGVTAVVAPTTGAANAVDRLNAIAGRANQADNGQLLVVFDAPVTMAAEMLPANVSISAPTQEAAASPYFSLAGAVEQWLQGTRVGRLPPLLGTEEAMANLDRVVQAQVAGARGA